MRVERPSGKKLFEEEQPMRKSWVMLLLAGIVLVMIVVNGLAFANLHHQHTPTPPLIVWIGVLAPLILLGFHFLAKLETIITDDGIYFRWSPWRKTYKMIPLSDLRRVTLRPRMPLKLGGSYVLGYGWIHQVRGREGVEINYAGERVWLGTQRLQAFLYALEKAGNGKIEIAQMQQKTSL